MAVIFNISGNTFNDHSSVIKNMDTQKESAYAEYIDELNQIKGKVKKEKRLCAAITELTAELKQEDEQKIGRVIKKYAADFSAAVFTNLVSSTLFQFIQLFLK